jgi:ribonuclease P protein component
MNQSSFIIFASKNQLETKHRVVVSKKVSKKAVERNLIKRRVKSVLQTLKTPKPLVIICRPHTQTLSFTELESELFQRLSAYNS